MFIHRIFLWIFTLREYSLKNPRNNNVNNKCKTCKYVFTCSSVNTNLFLFTAWIWFYYSYSHNVWMWIWMNSYSYLRQKKRKMIKWWGVQSSKPCGESLNIFLGVLHWMVPSRTHESAIERLYRPFDLLFLYKIWIKLWFPLWRPFKRNQICISS